MKSKTDYSMRNLIILILWEDFSDEQNDSLKLFVSLKFPNFSQNSSGNVQNKRICEVK